jgi:ribulose-5-phosphate 4-epimerase/fuculose-1-phosphate aldolase
VSQYVKFTYECVRPNVSAFKQLAELNECRQKLCELHLLGADSNGIGFGNLSVREGATGNFYVTASATGGLSELTFAHCVRVVAYDFEKNSVRYEGCAIPSSESLTHAAIYQSDPTTCAVIHCHDFVLWTTLLDRVPTTSQTAAYGTSQMANEIIRLFNVSDVRTRKIFVMAGHEGGIVVFGENFEDAFDTLTRERRVSSA